MKNSSHVRDFAVSRVRFTQHNFTHVDSAKYLLMLGYIWAVNTTLATSQKSRNGRGQIRIEEDKVQKSSLVRFYVVTEIIGM